MPGCLPLRTAHLPPRGARLVAAAVVCGDTVHTDWRHSLVIATVVRARIVPRVGADAQGFVDQHGHYYDRSMAAIVALRAGQIAALPGVLLSEDLWDIDGKPRAPGRPFDPAGE